MTREDSAVRLLRAWVASLLSALAAEGDDEAQARLLEACGAACAAHHGDLERAKGLSRSSPDLDALLSEVNRQVSWCGTWRRQDETIVSVCERCGCPLVRAGLVELTPVLCTCSRGFVRALFETVLERTVSVSLEQAIGRGDPVCRFVVRHQDTGPPARPDRPPSTERRTD